MIALLLMSILALTSSARAQGIEDCLNDDSYPLAGTSGYANGLDALRINAATYNATAFAERSIFPAAIEAMKADEKAGEDGDGGMLGATKQGPFSGWDPGGALVYEVNQTYGVARVPVWQYSPDCPAEYRVATRPMDLTSANLGAAGRYGRVGFFFSSAIVYGNLGEPARSQRIALGVVMPVVATYALATTPFSGNSQVIQGSTAWATDFIGGVSADLELVEVRAGYTASSGWYLSAGEQRIGLFGNTVARDGFSRFDQFAAGAKRVKWGELSDKGVGRSTLFARQVPMGEAEVDEGGERVTIADKLLTGHVRQDDIMGRFDIAFGYAFKPTTSVHDVEAAVHSRGFSDPGANPVYWRIAAGMVQLPTQHYYGLDGGTFLSVRGEVLAPLQIRDRHAADLAFTLMLNDEEQLAVFPFAYNAVTWRLNVTGRL
ncbi:MAG: hypothetical protein H6742_15010 [Alphaproteobacteria bacterium]|nr:hypothetical protein [Alphaproteobacteria bacterium]